MCLTIPGRVLSVGLDPSNPGAASVDFAGSVKPVSLLYLPEAKVGDYVLVHAGFATEVVPKDEALESLRHWAEIHALPEAGH